MLCLAHRRLGPADLVHRSSSPWSAALSSAPWAKGQSPGKTEQLLEVTAKRHQGPTSAWIRQMNVFISLPHPSPIHQPHLLRDQEQDKGKNIGKRSGRGSSRTRNLNSLLGGRLFSFTTLTRAISRIEVAWCFDSSVACAFVPRRSLPNGY